MTDAPATYFFIAVLVAAVMRVLGGNLRGASYTNRRWLEDIVLVCLGMVALVFMAMVFGA